MVIRIRREPHRGKMIILIQTFHPGNILNYKKKLFLHTDREQIYKTQVDENILTF